MLMFHSSAMSCSVSTVPSAFFFRGFIRRAPSAWYCSLVSRGRDSPSQLPRPPPPGIEAEQQEHKSGARAWTLEPNSKPNVAELSIVGSLECAHLVS